MTEAVRSGAKGLAESLPTQRLAEEARGLLEVFAEKALASISEKVSDKVGDTTRRLLEKVEGGGNLSPGVKAAISGVTALSEGKGPVRAALGAGMTGLSEKAKQLLRGGKGKKALKLTNVVETMDVGVPLRLAYDQWTQFEDFPNFMKKIEHVERPAEEKVGWKAQIFWSHRNWESTIVEQVPDDHIIWRSKGPKGYVDGAVSFSELAPNLTRICLVLEYHPQGMFEHTGNLWRAQGRRTRLELKHFRRHVMAHAILRRDEIEGWRGEIRDGEVVKAHEDALEEERRAASEKPEKAEEQPRGEREDEREEKAQEEPEEAGAEERPEPPGEEEEPEEPGEPEEAAEAEEPEAPPRRTRRPARDETRDEDEEEEEPEARPRRTRRPERAEAGDEDEEEPEAPPRRARRAEAGDEDEERQARPRRARRPERAEVGDEDEEEEEPEAPPRRARRPARAEAGDEDQEREARPRRGRRPPRAAEEERPRPVRRRPMAGAGARRPARSRSYREDEGEEE